jgi:hypothetical protein
MVNAYANANRNVYAYTRSTVLVVKIGTCKPSLVMLLF